MQVQAPPRAPMFVGTGCGPLPPPESLAIAAYGDFIPSRLASLCRLLGSTSSARAALAQLPWLASRARRIAWRWQALLTATLNEDLAQASGLNPARERLVRLVRDQPVLSIAESDPDCRGGTIFCLRILPDRVGFRFSLDAASRSSLRIDPRVLRVARSEEEGL
mgnify:CR=1 FL=1